MGAGRRLAQTPTAGAHRAPWCRSWAVPVVVRLARRCRSRGGSAGRGSVPSLSASSGPLLAGWPRCRTAVVCQGGPERHDVVLTDTTGELLFELRQYAPSCGGEFASPLGEADTLRTPVVLVHPPLDQAVVLQAVEELVGGLAGDVELAGQVADQDGAGRQGEEDPGAGRGQR